MTQQSVWSSGDLPPIIRLYRKPLLAEWVETGVALDALISHVIVHEAGHHFGFSDDDMGDQRIERDAGFHPFGKQGLAVEADDGRQIA